MYVYLCILIYIYSTLREGSITVEDYNHAVEVWQHFNSQTLGEYCSDLYLKIDVLLMANVFENVRNICLLAYHVDPVPILF